MLQTNDRKESRTHNRRLAKVAVQCSADTFVVNQSLVLRMSICGKKSPPSPSAKTLCTMPRDRYGAVNAGTFACCSFHRDTKASKRA